jgi:hypothetical protein
VYLLTSRRRSETTGGLADAGARNLILVSGGPGLYDNRDVEHDQSWANYVTPPMLLSEGARKHAAFVGVASEVWWLVYRPAYVARWSDDTRRRTKEVDRIRGLKFDSYISFLEGRARTRGWRLRWFGSADDLWRRLASFRDPISRLWYWGHAKNDLWLTLEHSSAAVATKPSAPGAVVTVASIAAHAALRSTFVTGSAHRFVGCNTAAFAREWSRVFDVASEGVQGTVDFSAIHATGGEPALVRAARWLRFRAAVPARP